MNKSPLQSLTTLALALSFFTAASSLSIAKVEPLDRVVAIVDEDVVLESEVQSRIEHVIGNLQRANRPAPPIEDLRQEVLNQLVVENIQLQKAQRVGLRISDAQLNESMQRIAAQNGMDLLQFKAALEQQGQSYTATREQIRKEMTIQRVQQGHVNRRIQITDQEIENFLSSDEGSQFTAPEYRMLHTLIPVASGADSTETETTKRYAESLQQRIVKGEDYREVVAGEHPYPLNTSDLGWRKAADLPSLIAGLSSTLERGETAELITSASGFHLVQLADKRGENETVKQTKVRHILLKPSAIRDDESTKAELEALRERIEQGEAFEDLAREYSEDIGSALEGGELDWTSPGQLVKDFQQMMDSSEPMVISPAFRSEYGWHILQVLERREKDVTDELRKNMARRHIHQRKFGDELQTWLQKIRDEAYVDFK